MIRWKTKAVAYAVLAGTVAAMLPTVMLYAPGPTAMAPATAPEQMVAPVRGDDWPVLENPDGDEIMIVDLRGRHANRPA
ncbi:MAG: hypothetical protein V3S64_15030 [bacterium]